MFEWLCRISVVVIVFFFFFFFEYSCVRMGNSFKKFAFQSMIRDIIVLFFCIFPFETLLAVCPYPPVSCSASTTGGFISWTVGVRC